MVVAMNLLSPSTPLRTRSASHPPWNPQPAGRICRRTARVAQTGLVHQSTPHPQLVQCAFRLPARSLGNEEERQREHEPGYEVKCHQLPCYMKQRGAGAAVIR